MSVPPSVQSVGPSRVQVAAGSDHSFTVSIMNIIEYLPLTNVSWMQSGSGTVTTNSTLPAYDGPVYSSLYLSSLSPDDSGVYAVIATNNAGDATVIFNLTVLPGKI